MRELGLARRGARVVPSLERRRVAMKRYLSVTLEFAFLPVAVVAAGGGKGGSDRFGKALLSKKSFAARTEPGFADVLGDNGGGEESGAMTSRSGSGRVLN